MGVESLLEAIDSSGSNDMPCTLWYLKFHYRLSETPAFGPVVSQINPFHSLQSSKIHFNIIIQSMSWSPYFLRHCRSPNAIVQTFNFSTLTLTVR